MTIQDLEMQIAQQSAQIRMLTDQLRDVKQTADATFTASNALARTVGRLDSRVTELEDDRDISSDANLIESHLLVPEEFPWRITGLGCRAYKDGSTCYVRVMKGKVRYHGTNDFVINQADMQITGGSKENPMWVYVRGTAIVGFTLATSMAEPKTDNVEYKFPLCAAYRAGSGTTDLPYKTVIVYYAQIGDICMISPLR